MLAVEGLNMSVSPAEDSADRALAGARGHWFDAANELDAARHRLLIASMNGEPMAERAECRESMYQATLYYWTALEAYARAQQHHSDLKAIAAQQLHREAI